MEILAMALILTSPAFANNGVIPKQYSCEGTDISPPLQWSGAPQGTKSFALIIDDPDAPDPRALKMTWVHWVVKRGWNARSHPHSHVDYAGRWLLALRSRAAESARRIVAESMQGQVCR